MSQLNKEPHEIGQLVIRIQAARVRQNPDTRVVNSFGLLSDLRFWFRERLPICAHSKNRDNPGSIFFHLSSQCPATRDKIFFRQLSSSSRSVRGRPPGGRT